MLSLTVYSMQSLNRRETLSGELADSIRNMILEGSIPPGRVNEVHLASELGVSRTPLREALMRLVSEGAVTTIPRRGFYVTPLTECELDQLYPLRAILDSAALRLAGLPSDKRLQRLRKMNGQLAAARTAAEAVRLDDEWHFELLADANPILLGFIHQLVWRTRRYELGLMKSAANVVRAVAEHEAIISALEGADLEHACSGLALNMSTGKERILDWLRGEEKVND